MGILGLRAKEYSHPRKEVPRLYRVLRGGRRVRLLLSALSTQTRSQPQRRYLHREQLRYIRKTLETNQSIHKDLVFLTKRTETTELHKRRCVSLKLIDSSRHNGQREVAKAPRSRHDSHFSTYLFNDNARP